MPHYSGAHISSNNGTYHRHVVSSQSYLAGTCQPSSSHSQNYISAPSSTQPPRLDDVQHRTDTFARRFSHHKYSHERSSASLSSPSPDALGSMATDQRSRHDWGGRGQLSDSFEPIVPSVAFSSFKGPAPNGGGHAFVSQSYAPHPSRKGGMATEAQPSYQYQYAPINGELPQSSQSQVEMWGASMSWQYESSHSPAPTESSQYRLSPSFSVQSSSSPDSLSDAPDEIPPRRRRRTKLSDCGSAASISSGTSSACHSPQLGTISSSSSSRKGSRDMSAKPGPSRKVRGKHAQTKQSSVLGEGPSFTVFMVKPSPALQEPSGATYMSTVDFDADASSDAFEHGPTDLPPRPYIGGPDATSPWKPRKNLGTIPGSAMDYLPVVEARMNRLEDSLNAYVEYRGQRAIQNAVLPGTDTPSGDDEMDCDSSKTY